MNAQDVITLLNLAPHPEGGFFRETYRSNLLLPAEALLQYGSARSASTCIYFMITEDSFSALHRVSTDEIFHFYLGDPIENLQILADGSVRTVRLGHNISEGEQLQVVIPSGVWQGARLAPGGKFGLIAATVAPGFDFADFELGDRKALLAQYPDCKEQIENFTK